MVNFVMDILPQLKVKIKKDIKYFKYMEKHRE